MILVIDNYDSFTYNLVQYLGTIRPDIQVVRNDQVTLEEIEKWDPSHILLSPGPGYPDEAGICIDVVRKNFRERSLYWESVWDIRLYVRPMGQ